MRVNASANERVNKRANERMNDSANEKEGLRMKAQMRA